MFATQAELSPLTNIFLLLDRLPPSKLVGDVKGCPLHPHKLNIRRAQAVILWPQNQFRSLGGVTGCPLHPHKSNIRRAQAVILWPQNQFTGDLDWGAASGMGMEELSLMYQGPSYLDLDMGRK